MVIDIILVIEPRFVGLKPSLVAASAIHAAVRGLRLENANLSFLLSEMASVSQDQLQGISLSIERVISSEVKAMEQEGLDGLLTKDVGLVAASAMSSKGQSCTYSSSNNNNNNSGTIISEEVLV